jgi:hypothetical protein
LLETKFPISYSSSLVFPPDGRRLLVIFSQKYFAEYCCYLPYQYILRYVSSEMSSAELGCNVSQIDFGCAFPAMSNLSWTIAFASKMSKSVKLDNYSLFSSPDEPIYSFKKGGRSRTEAYLCSRRTHIFVQPETEINLKPCDPWPQVWFRTIRNCLGLESYLITLFPNVYGLDLFHFPFAKHHGWGYFTYEPVCF